MARKFYGKQTFTATVNGNTYVINCYAQDTNYGFRHVAFLDNPDRYYETQLAKACYYNRTWESFRYETVLKSAIEKLPKADQEGLYNILIKKTAQEEHERCEKEFQAFEALFNKTSDTFKQAVANSNLIMNSDEDVSMVKSLMALDIVLNS
jgi:hypothetical protein